MSGFPAGSNRDIGHLRKNLVIYMDILRLVVGGRSRAYKAATLLFAISPPVICALFATGPERWNLFERSGALTTAIGFLLASRRYLRPGTIEIAIKEQKRGYEADMFELVEDIRATKTGLAVSAFGTLIWGAGKYLQWWTFSYLVIWAAMALVDVWRDFVRLYEMKIADSSENERTAATRRRRKKL